MPRLQVDDEYGEDSYEVVAEEGVLYYFENYDDEGMSDQDDMDTAMYEDVVDYGY